MLQTKSADGTFTPNKKAPIHRWFPYLEGYSAELVRNILSTAGDVKTVYDPFAGTGTTAVVATQSGISTLYSEINPFMRLVTEAKTTCVSALCASGEREKRIVQLADDVRHLQPDQAGTAPCWGDFAKYFDPEVLLRIRQLQHLISGIESSAARTIATVLLGAILVPVSRMKRRAI